MRIAFIRRRFSATGGAENYLARLAGAVAARGHEVTIYAESWINNNSAQNFWRVKQVPTNGAVAFARAIGALKLRESYDLVFSLERVPGADVYRAGDGVHAEWLRQRARYSPFLGGIRNVVKRKNQDVQRLEAEVFDPTRTGWIIANSEMVRTNIERHFAFPRERTRVIRNGVPVKRFASGNREHGRRALGITADEYIVLLVGAGEERKGVRYARKAVNKVHGANFLLIDSPPPCEMQDVYAAADIFLLPTLYDPFANVTLEALAAGLPVITTVHNGGSEILTHGKNGFVLEQADDVETMTQRIKTFRDPETRAAFREIAQACARQYDLTRNVDETLGLCDEIAASR